MKPVLLVVLLLPLVGRGSDAIEWEWTVRRWAMDPASSAEEIDAALADSDWRVRLWAFYNEVAIWALITMALSGLYLWLASRPKYRWAWVSFLTGSGAFAVLYVLTR